VTTYTFDPLREDDLVLARQWLLEPHVRRWWDDELRRKDYPEDTIRDWLEAIRGQDPTDMFLIRMDGRPIGVIQSYRVDSYPDHVAELGGLREPAFELDVFIGEPSLIGIGVGPDLLRAFLPMAFDRYGVEYCVIGPSRANVAAIRAYEKVGYRYLKDYREDDTKDPEHMLLAMHRSDLR
jgi:aminoglycoside 6'-N-acetyltransferase